MALNWYISEIKNYKKICWTPKDTEGYCKLKPITDVLIWATLSIEINKITSKNWKEFYFRINLIENMQGCFLTYGYKKEHFIKPEDIKKHIGLSTNSGYENPRKSWYGQYLKRMFKNQKENIGINRKKVNK